MFATRPAAKIIARDKNFRLAISWLVENESRIFAAVVLVSLFGKQPLAETRALDCLQILLRNDHVGIDIDDLQRGGDPFECRELVHSAVPVRGHVPRDGVLYPDCLVPQSLKMGRWQPDKCYATDASIASISSSDNPKWWPISWTRTCVTICPSVSSFSAQ